MARKTITVVDASGGESKAMLSNEGEYTRLLARRGVESLIDNEDCVIEDFESLEDGGRYTLGQPQRQRETGELRCCSKCCELLHYVLK